MGVIPPPPPRRRLSKSWESLYKEQKWKNEQLIREIENFKALLNHSKRTKDGLLR